MNIGFMVADRASATRNFQTAIHEAGVLGFTIVPERSTFTIKHASGGSLHFITPAALEKEASCSIH